MSFELEEVKNGKDIILYKNHKYRETYSVKCGDIVWKCLGKNCRASIKTNNEKTAIYSSTDTHSGQHPVTMRTMTPPTSQRRRCDTPSTPKPELNLSKTYELSSTPDQPTINMSTPTMPNIEKQNTVSVSGLAPTESQTYGPLSTTLPVTPDPPTFSCLEKENEFLRLKVAEQRYTIQAITTKTMELEVRLMENNSTKEETPKIDSLKPLTKPDDTSEDNCTSMPPVPLPQIELIDKLKTKIQVLEAEIECLRNNDLAVASLTSDYDKLSQIVEHQSETIRQLRKQIDHSSAFITPKTVVKPKPQLKTMFETENRFSLLDNVDLSYSEPGQSCRIETTAQVHRTASFSPRTDPKSKYAERHQREIKNKIIVLSDSQGKNMYPYIQNLANGYQVFVHTKPGAKLKHVVSAAKCFIKECTENDFVVLLAGTNDIGQYEPSQLSITQGLKSLLSLDVKTNVIINSVPYRFDTMQFNDKIFYANMAITKLIREYKGKLSLTYGELNTILHRCHFTRHGLHINKRGKRILGRSIVDTINSRVGPTLPQALDDRQQKTACTKPIVLAKTNIRQPNELEVNLSLIEPFPSDEVSMSDSEFITVASSSANGPCSDFQITSFKDFPPLTISPVILNKCNSTTEITTADCNLGNNTSTVFLGKT